MDLKNQYRGTAEVLHNGSQELFGKYKNLLEPALETCPGL